MTVSGIRLRVLAGFPIVAVGRLEHFVNLKGDRRERLIRSAPSYEPSTFCDSRFMPETRCGEV